MKKEISTKQAPSLGCWKGWLAFFHSSTATVPGPHMGNYLVLWHNWDWEFASHTLSHTHTNRNVLRPPPSACSPNRHYYRFEGALPTGPVSARGTSREWVDARVPRTLVLAETFHWIACNQHWLASKVPNRR